MPKTTHLTSVPALTVCFPRAYILSALLPIWMSRCCSAAVLCELPLALLPCCCPHACSFLLLPPCLLLLTYLLLLPKNWSIPEDMMAALSTRPIQVSPNICRVSNLCVLACRLCAHYTPSRAQSLCHAHIHMDGFWAHLLCLLCRSEWFLDISWYLHPILPWRLCGMRRS